MADYQDLDEEYLNKSPTYRDLWTFVKTAHGNQKRKTQVEYLFVPYYFHPLKVLELILNAQGRPIEASLSDRSNFPLYAAALLHDVMKDTPYNTPLKLATALRFFVPADQMEETVDIVNNLTNTTSLTAETKKQWQTTHARQMPFKAKLIKMADQISNVYDSFQLPPPWDFEKKCAYLDKAISVHQACLSGTEECPQLHTAFKRMDEIGQSVYTKALGDYKMRHKPSNDFFQKVKRNNILKIR